jgi:hypothetical protein
MEFIKGACRGALSTIFTLDEEHSFPARGCAPPNCPLRVASWLMINPKARGNAANAEAVDRYHPESKLFANR